MNVSNNRELFQRPVSAGRPRFQNSGGCLPRKEPPELVAFKFQMKPNHVCFPRQMLMIAPSAWLVCLGILRNVILIIYYSYILYLLYYGTQDDLNKIPRRTSIPGTDQTQTSLALLFMIFQTNTLEQFYNEVGFFLIWWEKSIYNSCFGILFGWLLGCI